MAERPTRASPKHGALYDPIPDGGHPLPSCPLLHVDHMPGIYEEPKVGPCCAHCGGDLGVRGPLSEPAEVADVG